jgi:hypothetical protein
LLLYVVYSFTIMPNLKFALRTLFKTPFVTIVAIVSLALGIGANAAILEKIQMPFTGIAARLPSVRPERIPETVDLDSIVADNGSMKTTVDIPENELKDATRL